MVRSLEISVFAGPKSREDFELRTSQKIVPRPAVAVQGLQCLALEQRPEIANIRELGVEEPQCLAHLAECIKPRHRSVIAHEPAKRHSTKWRQIGDLSV